RSGRCLSGPGCLRSSRPARDRALSPDQCAAVERGPEAAPDNRATEGPDRGTQGSAGQTRGQKLSLNKRGPSPLHPLHPRKGSGRFFEKGSVPFFVFTESPHKFHGAVGESVRSATPLALCRPVGSTSYTAFF